MEKTPKGFEYVCWRCGIKEGFHLKETCYAEGIIWGIKLNYKKLDVKEKHFFVLSTDNQTLTNPNYKINWEELNGS